MVEVYVELIIAGRKTFDKVPKKLKADVEVELKARGYGIDGKPINAEGTVEA